MRAIFSIGEHAVSLGVPRAYLGCPFVVTETGDTHQHINQYLFVRRNGDWHPRDDAEGNSRFLGRRKRRQGLTSLSNAAHHLDLFRRWCSDATQHDSDPLEMDQASEGDLDRWACAMEDGDWSPSGDALQPSTINQYLSSTIGYLQYAEHIGWRRKPLDLTTETAWVSGHGDGRHADDGKRRQVTTFSVMRRANPALIRYPAIEQAESMVEGMPTDSFRLGAILILRCGLRLAEVCNLPMDAVRSGRENRALAGHGAGFMTVVGKGGWRRDVEVPTEVVTEIDAYRDGERRRLVRAGRRRSGSEGEAATLLLGEAGGAMSRRLFADAFRDTAAALGFHLTPHLGRHAYAMHYLLRAWNDKESRSPTPLDRNLASGLLGVELVLLQQNMGHAHLSTTQGYLVGMQQFLGLHAIAERYNDRLDGGRE